MKKIKILSFFLSIFFIIGTTKICLAVNDNALSTSLSLLKAKLLSLAQVLVGEEKIGENIEKQKEQIPEPPQNEDIPEAPPQGEDAPPPPPETGPSTTTNKEKKESFSPENFEKDYQSYKDRKDYSKLYFAAIVQKDINAVQYCLGEKVSDKKIKNPEKVDTLVGPIGSQKTVLCFALETKPYTEPMHKIVLLLIEKDTNIKKQANSLLLAIVKNNAISLKYAEEIYEKIKNLVDLQEKYKKDLYLAAADASIEIIKLVIVGDKNKDDVESIVTSLTEICTICKSNDNLLVFFADKDNVSVVDWLLNNKKANLIADVIKKAKPSVSENIVKKYKDDLKNLIQSINSADDAIKILANYTIFNETFEWLQEEIKANNKLISEIKKMAGINNKYKPIYSSFMKKSFINNLIGLSENQKNELRTNAYNDFWTNLFERQLKKTESEVKDAESYIQRYKEILEGTVEKNININEIMEMLKDVDSITFLRSRTISIHSVILKTYPRHYGQKLVKQNRLVTLLRI